MRDSLEDRICAAGRHNEFKAALKKFRKSKRSNRDQHIFYEQLENLGADPEEADEFINMIMED